MKAFQRTKTILLLTGFIIGSIPFAEAQQRKAVFRVGVLEPGFRRPEATAPSACNSGFREGLRELGWIEGQNLRIEQRHGEFKPDQLRQFAAELVRIAPEVLWTHSPPAVLAAKQATTTIPIVFGVASDVIEQGLVAGSQARPAGNITGMELRDLEIMGKRLELLKNALPRASRIAVLVDATNSTHARVPGNIEEEARTLKVHFQRIEASTPEDIENAFAAISADALMIPEGAMFSQNRGRIFEIATSKRLPTIAGGQQFAEAGGLLSYGANIAETCRRSASFVDKLLKGSKPQELPIERPTKFEFVVNLKTAKQIGLTVPPNVLARADRVIK